MPKLRVAIRVSRDVRVEGVSRRDRGAFRVPGLPARRGISLTEIVVAVIFLTIALMPLLGLLVLGHQGTAATLHQTQSFHLADDVVEAVAALRYDQIQDATLGKAIELNMPLPQPAGGRPAYKRIVEVMKEEESKTADGKGKLRVKPVIVTVIWDGPGEQDRRTVRLVALASEVVR